MRVCGEYESDSETGGGIQNSMAQTTGVKSPPQIWEVKSGGKHI